MTEQPVETSDRRFGASRRQFLLGGAAASAGAAIAIGADALIGVHEQARASAPLNGSSVVPFYGAHQAGIDTDAQAHATLLGFDLNDGIDRNALRRMMRILTDDAARLTQGRAALADTEPELATAPARLTVTFGFGQRFVERADGSKPAWLGPLPGFSIDALQNEYSAGDVFIQVASDDPITMAHAARMLTKDTRSFASLRWAQNGFRRAHGTERPGMTMRNLFGQIDGTTNAQPGTADFDEIVWSTRGWLAGGTAVVLRRIRMNLDTWDELDRPGREASIGRYLSNGAPLTSSQTGASAEFDTPDFAAKTSLGFNVIPAFSHIARARPIKAHERIFRRSYNYEHFSPASPTPEAGLLFISYQADVERQFTPIQQRLDELDLLNEWTTPIGSSVFAIPPGCSSGGYIGETLLD